MKDDLFPNTETSKAITRQSKKEYWKAVEPTPEPRAKHRKLTTGYKSRYSGTMK